MAAGTTDGETNREMCAGREGLPEVFVVLGGRARAIALLPPPLGVLHRKGRSSALAPSPGPASRDRGGGNGWQLAVARTRGRTS
jgi:hypothetical protein